MDIEKGRELSTNIQAIRLVFPLLPDVISYDKLQIDRSSLRYITTPLYFKQMMSKIHRHLKKANLLPKDVIITDAMACVGGDTIAFAKTFRYVYSFEIDDRRCEMLKNNVSVYNLENVSIYCKSFLNGVFLIDDHHIVYMDPPWETIETYGNYSSQRSIRIQIEERSIEQICIDLFSHELMKKVPEFVILKLPMNYDMNYFYSKIKEHRHLEMFEYFLKNKYGLAKMRLLILRRN